MEANISLGDVLDLLNEFQEDIAGRVDEQPSGTISHRELWEVYKRTSRLYDDIRRAAT